jgi:dUTP pyrophosphatase
MEEKKTQSQIVEQAKKEKDLMFQKLLSAAGSLDTINVDDVPAGMEPFYALLGLPEDDFEVLAPAVLEELTKSMNIQDKIMLAQTLNATGHTYEDLVEEYNQLYAQIDTADVGLSQQKKDFLKQYISIMTNSIADTEGIAKRIITIPIELISEDAKIPTYAHTTDSGMDVYSVEDITINPGETKLVHTGLKVAIPKGFEIQVRPKSGLSLKTAIRVGNAPGTIDAGYRDEIGIIIDNIEPPIKDITYHFDEYTKTVVVESILHGSPITIAKGQKIAQLVLAEIPKINWLPIDHVADIGEDRGGGFGSTGLM